MRPDRTRTPDLCTNPCLALSSLWSLALLFGPGTTERTFVAELDVLRRVRRVGNEPGRVARGIAAQTRARHRRRVGIDHRRLLRRSLPRQEARVQHLEQALLEGLGDVRVVGFRVRGGEEARE